VRLTSLTLCLAALAGCGPFEKLFPGPEPGPSAYETPAPTSRPSNTYPAPTAPPDNYYPAPTATPDHPFPAPTAPPVVPSGTYAPQAPVSLSTTPEKKTMTSTAGEATTLVLSDGTEVYAPALNTPFSLTLEKQSNTLPLAYEGLQKTGSLRVLNLQNLQSNTATFPVTIRFPASEAGNIHRNTLGVARVADILVNGVLQKDHFTLLPAVVDSQGQIKAIDYLFSQTSGMKVLQSSESPAGIAIAKATLKYFLVTQQANLNWAAAPELVRMVPDQALLEKRKPLNKLAAKERSFEEKKCVRNVVVLVHGHNEAEKDGYLGKPDVAAPWNFSYKRDVWTPLYYSFLTTPGLDTKSSCTAFYEYVYPSFRSAFDSLGPDLATKIKAEMQPLLANPDADPNLLIVAHSMGGLVARAGIQQFDAPLHKAFQRLLTWGTPHHGSILSSLAYVMNAGSHYSLLGQADADSSEILSRLVQNYVQIEAPGARDLRWDNARPLRLNEWFEKGPTQPDNDAVYSLTAGTRIYNTKLKALNETDLYASPSGSGLKNRVGQLKYYFAYGRTDKTLIDSMIGIGATAARRLIKNPDSIFDENFKISENDGAVPVTSAGGEGLNAERERFTGVDHEEFYGAARGPSVYDGASTFEQPSIGAQIADMTFNKLYLTNSALSDFFKCDPTIKSISPLQGEGGTAVQIKGQCFNNADDKLAVYFNNQKAQNIAVKNCSEITVNAPANVSSGDVKVVANGQTSNGVRFSTSAQQTQDLCKNMTVPGIWSVVLTTKTGTTINATLTAAADGSFTSATGGKGNWELSPDLDQGGWYVSFIYYTSNTRFEGHTQEPSCELKGKHYSGIISEVDGDWTGQRN
jgi:triacylglycerol esterase/lipase EstA (alpha/beta hydrolase family)